MKLFEMWRKRWLFVKDSCVGYFGKDGQEIRCVLLMDQGFKVITGAAETGSNSGIIISNLSHQIVIKSWTKRKAQEWLDCIEKAIMATGISIVSSKILVSMAKNLAQFYAIVTLKLCNDSSWISIVFDWLSIWILGLDFINSSRFGSYAPVRCESPCTWFVDGCDYMDAVADAIELAKEEIFIADWWLSPEIYLKRPTVDRDKWRLDNMLHRKAVSLEWWFIIQLLIDPFHRSRFASKARGRSYFRTAIQRSGDGFEHQQPLHETTVGFEASKYQSAPPSRSRFQWCSTVGPPREVGSYWPNGRFRRRHRPLLRPLGWQTT